MKILIIHNITVSRFTDDLLLAHIIGYISNKLLNYKKDLADLRGSGLDGQVRKLNLSQGFLPRMNIMAEGGYVHELNKMKETPGINDKERMDR